MASATSFQGFVWTAMLHFVLPSLVPILVLPSLLGWTHDQDLSLLPWELAALAHTIVLSTKLIGSHNLEYISERHANWIKRGTWLVLLAAIVLKVLGVVLHVLKESGTEGGLFIKFHDALHVMFPHWVMLPAFVFLLANVALLLFMRRHRTTMHVTGESTDERAMGRLIATVDVPVVGSYVVLLTYSVMQENADELWLRSAACTLLVSSNLLTLSFDWSRTR